MPKVVIADESDWTDEELTLRSRLQAGHTIVISFEEHHTRLREWARLHDLLRVVDRSSEWGNPFVIPVDGTREEVIEHYRDHYLPHKPSLLSRVAELKGRALVCWCAPQACHGDILAGEADAT